MSNYGIFVNDQPAFENLGMLYDVIDLSVFDTDDAGETITLPPLNDDSLAYLVTFGFSDIKWGKNFRLSSYDEIKYNDAFIIQDEQVIIDDTHKTSYFQNKAVSGCTYAKGIKVKTFKFLEHIDASPKTHAYVWVVKLSLIHISEPTRPY